MRVIDRVLGALWGKGRAFADARRAELRGDFTRAVVRYADAARLDEAARVLLLQGDSEAAPQSRLPHYTRAAATAPIGSEVHRTARKKRAELVIALSGGTEGTGPPTAAAKYDVREAARELEALGESDRAAAVYARIGDAEGEARALANAGDVDKLEFVLGMQETKERALRRQSGTRAEIDLLLASGRRRDALARLDDLARESPGDLTTREQATALRARRALGPVVRVIANGTKMTWVLGDTIEIGRTEGTLHVTSNAVSRRHLKVGRARSGAIVLEDLGGRNGTYYRGLKIAGALPIGDGLEVRLGNEVTLRVAPHAPTRGVVLELAGTEYVAPLGEARLPIEGWALHVGEGAWIELATNGRDAYVGDVALIDRSTLLQGDRIGDARGEKPVLEILG